MRRTIRVLHVVYSFDTGGMEKGIAMLVSGSSPEFEHVVVCTGRSGAAARLLPNSTRVVELNKPSGNSVRFLLKLSRCLRGLRPDVVHTRNWSGMDGIVAARLAGITGVVQGEHGWGMEDPEGVNRKRILARRFLARWVREFTCVSGQMVGWLRDGVKVRRPITQVYNGVDTSLYCPGAPSPSVITELSLSDRNLVLGTVGRLDPIKDHPSLMEAFARVKREFPDMVLLVVGEGAERDRLERMAPPGIRFLGDREDVQDLLKLMDVFVLPSINEGISNTILEAMAAARPIIATRVGGNPELVSHGETGLLVSPRSPDELAGAIAKYASSDELRRMHGAAGRRMVMQRFSIPGMVSAYETVYRRIAAA